MIRTIKFVLSIILVLYAFNTVFATPAICNEESNTPQIKIITSFYPLYITALNVTKEIPGITVKNLTTAYTGCLHDYVLTTDDMKELASSNIMLINGAGMESFLDQIAKQFPKLLVINLSEGIDLIKDQNGEENAHVFVSIPKTMQQIINLTEGLEKFYPQYGNQLEANKNEYLKKLNSLDIKMKTALATYKGKKIITFHEAFPYFADEFNFEVIATVESEPGSEPNAREFARLIDLIKINNIKVLFTEPQYQSSSAKSLAKETGTKIYKLDPAVTGPNDPDAYLKIMEENLVTLITAFNE